MKISFKNKIIALFFVSIVSVSCNEEFLIRDSEDSISLDSYYATDTQVKSATNSLYCKTWFNFNNKAFFAIGEIGSGNMFSYSSDVAPIRTFSMSSSDTELLNSWKSLWATIAQANSIINYLPSRVGPDVSKAVLDNTIGEAYFMRATAYFYLVRLWGPVPIIENNSDFIDTPQINTNRVVDVYKLIKNDYAVAISKLVEKSRGANYSDNGHVSKGSAKAMLAKVCLYDKDYAQAKSLAESVINSGEFKLLGGSQLPAKTFGDLFTVSNNNNEESIFALQWKVTAGYGTASNCNTQFGYSTNLSNASYGGVFAPSQDILTLYSAADKRRKETFMMPGDVYPDLNTATGMGLTVPTDIDSQGSGLGIKKYVVGKVTSEIKADAYAMMENNTYIMRYADLLLIHAEAVLAGGTSTSDASALSSINAVRTRAGLSELTSITFDDIFTERRKELAFEGDYWYDLGRIPRAKAIAIMQNQNRGDKTTAAYYTPTDKDFTLPYPDSDVAKNPKLNEAPVPYTFK